MNTRSVRRVFLWPALAAWCWIAMMQHTLADTPFIIVQSTTSTENSGLYDWLLPTFFTRTGIEVRVVSVGTGQAIKNAQNCDGDVLIVHSKEAEEQFVASGFGRHRYDLMYNDYVVIGPANDPADVAKTQTAISALQALFARRARFVSRGDDSGTHKAEMRLWRLAQRDPTPFGGRWYRESGSGMGATINLAVEMNAYALTDRATWTSFQRKGRHRIVSARDTALTNQYGVIPIEPGHCPSAKFQYAEQFTHWLLSAEGQQAIGEFRVNDQQLFFPNAR